MLKRSLSTTPTITITFDHQTIATPPTVFDYNPYPISPSTTAAGTRLGVPRILLLNQEGFPPVRKRRRTLTSPTSKTHTMTHNRNQHSMDDVEPSEDKEGSVLSALLPSSPEHRFHHQRPAIFSRANQNPLATPTTPAPAPNMDAIASDFAKQRQAGQQGDVGGPSRIGLRGNDLTIRGAPPLQPASRPRKKPARLTLQLGEASSQPSDPSSLQVKEAGLGSRSVPSSPLVTAGHGPRVQDSTNGREQLRENLRGAPRRRPSVPFGLRISALPMLSISSQSTLNTVRNPLSGKGPPPVWQDPSEHILSGNGSSLQHARSVYASGPVEVLPGLFLGDEFNARDDACLVQRGITTVLNVAKETTLPFQADGSNQPLDFFSPTSLSTGLQRSLVIGDPATTPTSATHARDTPMDSPPATASRETFYTPVSSMPLQSTMSPARRQSSHSSSPTNFYLRNTTSTPNLHLHFINPSRTANNSQPARYEDEEEEEVEDGATSSVSSQLSHNTSNTTPPSPTSVLPSLDPHGIRRMQGPDRSDYSPANLSITTQSSNSGHSSRSIATTSTGASSSSSSSGSYSIALPHNAIALNVQPSPQSGRKEPMRYIKLPWTHDETELAGSAAGGFVTGCSIIADALGIDLPSGQFIDRTVNRGGVLVHCQCGVSRSATLVIAFVMQAAALNYSFEETQRLTGMHDCYEMVKELSSSISPNCSLIYQLVEWERFLSKQVASIPPVPSTNTVVASKAVGVEGEGGKKRWGNEAMSEEDWTRMRMDEERKEREEEEKRREATGEEERSSQRRQVSAPASNSNPMLSLGEGGKGLGARRKRPTPSLTLTSSAKSATDKAVEEKNAAAPLVAMQEGEGEREGEEMMVDEDRVVPLSTRIALQGGQNNGLAFSPAPRTGSSSASSATSTLVSAETPLPPGPFGVHRQSAAERRNKHKRTFSSELPDWNRRLSVTMTPVGPGEKGEQQRSTANPSSSAQ